MTSLLNDEIRKQVQEIFVTMKEPVHILFFGSQERCETCQETRLLVEEVVSLSDKLSLDQFDLIDNKDIAEKYNVERSPGLVITSKDGATITDHGILLSGIPSGHEFTTLIQDIFFVSRRDSGLSEETRTRLKKLKKPVHLQVFVTPT